MMSNAGVSICSDSVLLKSVILSETEYNLVTVTESLIMTFVSGSGLKNLLSIFKKIFEMTSPALIS